MNDNMTVYFGVAQSYKELPLIALRELESVLKHEIYERECSFGMHEDSMHKLDMHKNSGEKLQGSEVSVGEAGRKGTVGSGGKSVNNNVIQLILKGSKV